MAAFLANPGYGYVPGAPRGLNYWTGNTFNMSDLLASLPPALPVPPPPPPPPPMTATVTPQDVAVQQLTLSGGRGAEPGGGGPGTGAGGIGGASGGGQDTTTSGYSGVYAQSPVDLQSRFGEVGGLVGAGAGTLGAIPGIGTALGFGGGMLDAARINDTLAQYGMPGHVNPWGAGFAQALAGIGIPFTDLNLARAFNVPTAQERLNSIIDAAAPGLYNTAPGGYGAIQANAPVGPATVGAAPAASYPSGFLDWSAGLASAGAAPSDKGAFDPGAYAEAAAAKGAAASDMTVGGQSTGTAADKGDIGSGDRDVSGSSSQGGDKGGGDLGGYYTRGGLIGAPPGRYAAGGAVPMPGDNITPAQFGLLRGVNPPGPDDQIGALQTGEGVLTAKTMRRYPGLLDAANAGKLPKRAIGLLAVVPAKPRRPR